MSVMILGETGTGKEYVAQEIHHKSARAKQPFVAVDCGALPPELAGSELFGHVKGAFTGALHDKKGAFELANGGTLFLDELGNLSYENQIKLLRVLQERSIKPVGGTKQIPVDVRVLVATNEHLQKAIKQGDFREDIFFRLNEFSIKLSPLRERTDDITRYAEHFLELANQQLAKEVKAISKDAMNCLKAYHWHGNLRELNNVIKRAVLLSQGSSIEIEALPSEICHPPTGDAAAFEMDFNGQLPKSLKSVVEQAEKTAITEVLRKTNYNKSKTAELLQVDRKTLYNKIKTYQIEE